jgi:hypothetical protein
VPIAEGAGWALEPVWTRAENLAFTGTRFPYLAAPSQSVYRLSYYGHDDDDDDAAEDIVCEQFFFLFFCFFVFVIRRGQFDLLIPN